MYITYTLKKVENGFIVTEIEDDEEVNTHVFKDFTQVVNFLEKHFEAQYNMPR